MVIEMPEQVISGQLGAGERLLGSGRPRQGLFLRPSDAALIPFSLMWGGFAVFWEYGVINSSAPFFFRLWGIPFVAIGLYMIFGRFFVDTRQRAHMYYGVTSQRVLIVSGLFSREAKSLNLKTLTDVSLSERAKGAGTIYFGSPGPWWASSGMQWPGAGKQAVPSFESIERAREVYNIVRSAQAAA